jgi:tRNA pseudouridine38-40 synthase
MYNYKLHIQYDGTNYAGWQIQKNSDTVQQRITDALNMLLKEDINLIGSGRTDSGVHALGQQANFKTEKEIDIYRTLHSLNSILPKDIAVSSFVKVPEYFNARYDARKRSYLYFIIKSKSPFYDRYSYFYHNSIDLKKLNCLSKSFIREADFTSFSRKNSSTENKICNVYTAQWYERNRQVIFLIEANRFLHGMVRTVTGTLLNALKNNYNEDYIEDIFAAGNRDAAGEAVPAKGLFLYKVRYGNNNNEE